MGAEGATQLSRHIVGGIGCGRSLAGCQCHGVECLQETAEFTGEGGAAGFFSQVLGEVDGGGGDGDVGVGEGERFAEGPGVNGSLGVEEEDVFAAVAVP